MINSVELYNTINNSEVINYETEAVLLELDETPSTATQAYLNGLLHNLYSRIINGNTVRLESSHEAFTGESFIEWVHNNFTKYSSDMFDRTMEDKN